MFERISRSLKVIFSNIPIRNSRSCYKILAIILFFFFSWILSFQKWELFIATGLSAIISTRSENSWFNRELFFRFTVDWSLRLFSTNTFSLKTGTPYCGKPDQLSFLRSRQNVRNDLTVKIQSDCSESESLELSCLISKRELNFDHRL